MNLIPLGSMSLVLEVSKMKKTKIIAINLKSGGVAIMHVLKKDADLEKEVLKWDSYVDPADGKTKQKNSFESYSEITEKDIPTDRTFRAAWKTDSKGKFKVDMQEARKIQMNKIRLKRDEKLKELDIETLRGVDVQKEKQALRDIPQTFSLDEITDPEELKNKFPKELK